MSYNLTVWEKEELETFFLILESLHFEERSFSSGFLDMQRCKSRNIPVPSLSRSFVFSLIRYPIHSINFGLYTTVPLKQNPYGFKPQGRSVKSIHALTYIKACV